MKVIGASWLVSCLLASAAYGQLDIPSDGMDGVFMPGSDTEVDLSLAASMCDCDGGGMLDDPCTWDCPSPVEGQGVYDAEQSQTTPSALLSCGWCRAT